MRPARFAFVCLLTCSAFFSSCSKNEPTPGPNPNPNPIPPQPTIDTTPKSGDLYVAGISGTAQTGAAYWNTRTKTKINLIAIEKNISVYGIGMVGKDVYVSGTVSDSIGNSSAVYWKNGEQNVLARHAEAWGLFISGSDIYIAGSIYSLRSGNWVPTPVYWKNGVMTSLTTMTNISTAHGIYVSGNDVYVSGMMILSSDNTPVYWKNGTMNVLSTPKPSNGWAYAIDVSGGDVYTAGYYEVAGKIMAMSWKNTTAAPLVADAMALSIGVAGTTVHVGGANLGSNTNYWTAGAGSAYAGNTGATVRNLLIKGQDVYAAGDIYTGLTLTGNVWKNGVQEFSIDHYRCFAVTMRP